MSSIDQILANRVAYIGEEIPRSLADDERPKTVYLGYPVDLISDLKQALYNELEAMAKTIPVHSGTDSLNPKEYIQAIPLSKVKEFLLGESDE